LREGFDEKATVFCTENLAGREKDSELCSDKIVINLKYSGNEKNVFVSDVVLVRFRRAGTGPRFDGSV
jgi:hypothetical protein